MESSNWKAIIENAQCPEMFSRGGIGPHIEELNVTFYPGDSNIEKLNQSDDVIPSRVEIHSHGICLWIGSNVFAIGNDQIVLVDTIDHDEYVTTKKNMMQYAAFGAMLASGGIPGAIIGGTIGALFGIGNKTTHIKGTFLRVAFWDKTDRLLKYVLVDYEKRKEDLLDLVQKWKQQKEINENTGRKPQEVKEPGCFGMLLLLISLSSLYFCFG